VVEIAVITISCIIALVAIIMIARVRDRGDDSTTDE
jgi:hypothetical protein